MKKDITAEVGRWVEFEARWGTDDVEEVDEGELGHFKCNICGAVHQNDLDWFDCECSCTNEPGW